MSHYNPYDSEFDDRDPPDNEGTACKFCGAEGLTWVHTGVRWRLADGHGLHVCPSVATADDFDEVKP